MLSLRSHYRPSAAPPRQAASRSCTL